MGLSSKAGSQTQYATCSCPSLLSISITMQSFSHRPLVGTKWRASDLWVELWTGATPSMDMIWDPIDMILRFAAFASAADDTASFTMIWFENDCFGLWCSLLSQFVERSFNWFRCQTSETTLHVKKWQSISVSQHFFVDTSTRCRPRPMICIRI